MIGDTRRRMLLWTSPLRRRGRTAAQGAMPLPRMSVHQRRLAESVHADAAEGIPLCERSAQNLYPQRSRPAGDARILRELRHASDYASPGSAFSHPEGRNSRRPEPVWRPADGDLHARQAALPYDPGRRAGVRTTAAALVWVNRSPSSPLDHLARGDAIDGIESQLGLGTAPNFGIGDRKLRPDTVLVPNRVDESII
jgi:hypothetical protein